MHADQHLRETPLARTELLRGHFLHVVRDTVRLPDGQEATREFVLHPGAVMVIGLLDDGRVVLERQYRHPMQQVMIEFPAGKLDAGEGSLACAQREMREETGYSASDWQFICTIHNAIAYSDEHLDIFLARGLVSGEQQLDPGEFLELISVSPDALMTWVREGKITDVKTLIGAFWLDKILRGEW